MPKRILLLCLLLRAHACFGADGSLVFNEVHYQPAAGSDGIEWIELRNLMAVDMEVSGWRLSEGVDYQFPPGMVVPGGGYLVLAADPAALMAVTSVTNVLGPFSGRLANEGERIDLRNQNGRLMDSLRYGSDDPWPAAPAGSGATLAKRSPLLPSADPASWTSSGIPGGTPGRENFAADTPEPATFAFSELTGADAPALRVELTHRGSPPTNTDGLILRRVGGTTEDWRIPTGAALQPGALLVVDPGQPAWIPRAGDRLFLLSADGARVLDAAIVGMRTKARQPSDDRWLVPAQDTFGASNVFALHPEIVINEIQYHPRPLPGQPAVTEETLLLPITADWRFNQSDGALGNGWRTTNYDDSTWSHGGGAFFVETAELPAPKTTPLTLGRITYYFRTRFVFDGDTNGAQVVLRPLIDDGAVIYLNGTEVQRINLADGPVTYATLATPGVSDATFGAPISLGAGLIQRGTNVLAVEVHQTAATSSDIVFGLEVSLVRQVSPEVPRRESPEAWVELFNRSTNEVDLSGWRFADGIRYAFSPGTRLGAGEYLVVAGNSTFLRERHPAIRILGDFTGQLSARSDRLTLLDDLGNPADEVRYFDRKPWPSFADGGGSSLELRDPRSDRRRPEAWQESDETGQSRWNTYTYTGVALNDGGPTRWNELVMGLLDEGEALVDDLSVLESPDLGGGRSLVQNGDFENDGASWRFLGNHRRSRVEADPDRLSNHVLHLVASGPTEHMHNHVETTLAGNAVVVDGRSYRISFRAKTLTGSPRLNTRLYFGRLGRTTVLEVPEDTGTPGRRNSRFVENAGPTFTGLQHRPVVPAANEPVRVSLEAADPDGVLECRLWWSLGGTSWQDILMEPGDDGRWAGMIPPQPTAAVVQFYVEATDRRGARSTYPAAGRDARALFQVRDAQAANGRLHQLRIVMTPADSTFQFATTNVMSNESLGGTVIHDESEVFYDVGVRLQSSERGRADQSRVGFAIEFPADHLFRGVHDSVTLDRSGGYSGRGGRQDEIVLRHIINQAGGLPEIYPDLVRGIYPRSLEGRRNGVAMLLLARYGDSFLDDAFVNGSAGGLFKLELVYFPTTSVGGDPQRPKLPQPDDVIGTDIQDRGNDPEAYRWYFLTENRRSEDDYTPIIRLARAFNLSGQELDREMRQRMDVDQWARAFAVKSLSGDADTYGFGYPHNQVLYFRPSDGRALAFPWDMDFAWARSATDSLTVGANIGRLLALPANHRLFLGHVLDLLNRSYNPAYLGRWTTHYGQLAGQNYSGVLAYVQQRGAAARRELPARVPFEITTGGGQDFLTNAKTVTLTGTAWIDLKDLTFSSPEVPGEVTWNSITTWQVTIPLVPGRNRIECRGFGFDGGVLASNVITVTSSALQGGLDSDGDTLPDSWEARYGTDPGRDDAGDDPDGDRFTNLQEFVAGTDPWSANDRLALGIVSTPAGISLRFTARPGRAYVLESRENIAQGPWQSVRTWAPIAGEQEISHDENRGLETAQRLYRLRISASP